MHTPISHLAASMNNMNSLIMNTARHQHPMREEVT